MKKLCFSPSLFLIIKRTWKSTRILYEILDKTQKETFSSPWS